MGYQERDYYRDESTGPALGINVSSVVMRLVLINGALFLANLILHRSDGPEAAQNWLTKLLLLHGDTLQHPEEWYRLLTAGFVHNPKNIGHILFNMVGLYSLGKPLEDRYGGWEFLRFYLLSIVFSSMVWSARQIFLQGNPDANMLGASGGVTATIILFCLLYPKRTLLLFFAIPIPAWIFGALIIASDMFGAKAPWQRQANIAYETHLAGALFALGYWYFGWNFGRLPGVGAFSAQAKKWRRSLAGPRPDLRLHEPEEGYEDLDAEADRVLDKLHREGEASLTKPERRVLEAYSRRMRQKHR